MDQRDRWAGPSGGAITDEARRSDRRDLWQGFGDGLTQAFEMAVTPILFALLGHFLDGQFGTRPILTVFLVVFAMVGAFLRTWYHYLNRVQALEDGKVWHRRAAGREAIQ